MASIHKRGEKWRVHWRDPDGRARARTVPTKRAAVLLRREVEETIALGRRWQPEDATPVPELAVIVAGELVGGAFVDFLTYAEGLYAAGTVRHYDRALRRYLVHLAELHPGARRWTMEMLTRDSLETWFGAMVGEQGLAVSTARLYIGAAQTVWQWAWESDTYGPSTPRPRSIRMPTPRRRPARAPTWEQMDAAIDGIRLACSKASREAPPHMREHVRRGWAWRRRLLIVLRFTGLRVQQVMRLTWDDVDLDRQELVIDGALGKSSREQTGRIVPISPHLVETLAGWGRREGWLIAPHKTSREALSPPTAEAWEAAGVPGRAWRRRPHHALRKGYKTGLAQLGVDRDIRDYLVGHHRGIDDYYIDALEGAREAVRLIPDLTVNNVRRLNVAEESR